MMDDLIIQRANNDETLFQNSRKTETKSSKIRHRDSPLYASIRPLVYIVRFFGLAPYEFDENDELVSSTENMIFSFIFIGIYTFCMYSVWKKLTGVGREGKSVFGQVETCKAITNYIVAVFDIMLTVLSRNKFTKVWKVIRKYDEALDDLCLGRKERTTAVWVWSIIIFNVVVWLGINQSGMIAFDQSFIDNLIYLIMYLGPAVSVIKFSGIVLMLRQRFSHLNDIARKNCKFPWGGVYNRSKIIDTVLVEQLYDILMTAGEKLDEIYSWAMLGWMTNLTLHIVSDLYFILDPNILFKIAICLLAWMMNFILQTLLLNLACYSAAYEANCVVYTLFEWKRRQNYFNKNMSVEHFLHMKNRELQFSAAGCFSLGLPLLRTVAAASCTYLVVLLQFD